MFFSSPSARNHILIESTQYWRLFTTFIYFGPLSLNLLFHIFFIQRYARMLEESAVSQAHFTWMLCYAITTLLCLAPLVSVVFLGSILSSTLVYIWSRKHPDVQLSFLGLFVFRAPWLPWVMIGLSVVMHGNWPKDELCGIAVGHGELSLSLFPFFLSILFSLLFERRNANITTSLLLLQRHIPSKPQWPTTLGSPCVVAKTDTRKCRCGCRVASTS
jgi:hypothetical protein